MPGSDEEPIVPLIRGVCEPRRSFFLIDSGLISCELPVTRGSGPEPVRAAGAGRRKAATEIMPLPWRAPDFPGANGSPCGCGRERCELTGLTLEGSSGGVRKDELLRLANEGEDGRPSTILGGGSCACCAGEEGVDAPSGDGVPFVGEGRSEEVRGTGGDPDTRPCARAKGEEGGGTESMLVRGDECIGVGVVGVGRAKG